MWTLQDAKNKFSAVVEAAMRHKPQLVTKRGKPAVVVLAVEDYERLNALDKASVPTLVDLLLEMPQGDIEFENSKVEPRPVDFSG
jgi:prevent-host-death family protein